MSDLNIHLMRGGIVRDEDMAPDSEHVSVYLWCEPSSLTLPVEFVAEPLFATCRACLDARIDAATKVGVP